MFLVSKFVLYSFLPFFLSLPLPLPPPPPPPLLLLLLLSFSSFPTSPPLKYQTQDLVYGTLMPYHRATPPPLNFKRCYPISFQSLDPVDNFVNIIVHVFLYVTSHFSLAAFKILSFPLIRSLLLFFSFIIYLNMFPISFSLFICSWIMHTVYC